MEIQFNLDEQTVIFTTIVQYGHIHSFNSYYGSMSCYDDDYVGEKEYNYELTFDELSERVSEYIDGDYLDDLSKRDPQLYKQLMIDVINNTGLKEDIQEEAQESYNDKEESGAEEW